MAASHSIDVQAFLNEHPFSAYRWLVFALCFFIVLLDGFDTAAIGYIAPSLVAEWGVERPALAPVLSAALFGWLMDRFDADLVIASGFALTAAAIWAIGQAAGDLALLMAAVFLAGTLMNTAQSSLPALAAGFYPTQGRATGAAWMLGLGRFGGIAGSFLVAELARRRLGFSAIFTVVAVPGLLAAAALLVKRFAHAEAKSPYAAAKGEALGR